MGADPYDPERVRADREREVLRRLGEGDLVTSKLITPGTAAYASVSRLALFAGAGGGEGDLMYGVWYDAGRWRRFMETDPTVAWSVLVRVADGQVEDRYRRCDERMSGSDNPSLRNRA